MKKIGIISLVLGLSMSLHQNNQNSHKKVAHKLPKHQSDCQFCSDCVPVIGGSYECNSCPNGEQPKDGVCPPQTTIENCGIQNEDGKCVWCISGYRLNDDYSSCQACGQQNCQLCDNEQCYYCEIGYHLNQDGQCEQCPQNCLYCPKGQCQSCSHGFFLEKDGKCGPCADKECFYCLFNANQCLDEQILRQNSD